MAMIAAARIATMDPIACTQDANSALDRSVAIQSVDIAICATIADFVLLNVEDKQRRKRPPWATS